VDKVKSAVENPAEGHLWVYRSGSAAALVQAFLLRRRILPRMPYKSTRASVAYALVGFAEDALAPIRWGEALRASLVPGTRVERYGRRWFMCQWNQSDDARWIIGRLAFESTSDEPGIWDEERKDVRMIETLGMAVQVAPFVIDTQEQRVAFELRSQTIRPGTFQGNLQALLIEASNLPWRVKLEGVRQPAWEEWAKHITRLTAVWITMRPPNPHSPLPELEELFTKGVNSAQIVARGDDIELEDAALLEAAFGHARDYGKISAEAVVEDHKEQWKSEEEGGVRKDEALRDDGGHVPPEELQQLLEHRANERPQDGDAEP
jgi:hypothetical protein